MRIFKNTKKVFALVLAMAIVAMSMFTGFAVSADCNGTIDKWEYDAELGLTYDDGYLISERVVGTGSEADPYIISTAEQLASLCAARFKDAGGNNIDTTGKFFKVADGIKAFYMNGGEAVANLKSAEEVKAWFEDANNSKSQWWLGNKFKGTFDGNGVTVYGIYCTQNQAGFFHKIDGATIKNLAIENSYFSGVDMAGAIAAGIEWVNGDVYGDTSYYNCIVKNNYIAASTGFAGAVVGQLRNTTVTSSNIFVEGNILECTKRSGVFGDSDRVKVENIIAIGTTAWSLDGGWNASHIDTGNYKNIYTDQSVQELMDYAPDQNTQTNVTKYNINQLTVEQMTGAAAKENMSDLNAEAWFANATTYPVLRAFHKIELIDNGDGTHVEKCADCGIADAQANHTYVDGECVCGAAEPGADPSISEFVTTITEVSLLDPTKENSESNPYVIENAGQMYALMLAKCTSGGVTIDTAGKFFKVADGVKAFYMNGGATVAAMTTVDQVKDYFTNNSYTKVWTGGNKFMGTFDGNGVTVYGVGSDGGEGGLFPEISGNVTVKNVTVKNSYLVGSNAAGGIVGDGNNGLLSSVTIENCAVVNNYISAGRGDSGAGGLAGFLYNSQLGNAAPLTINNCLVAGNEIVSTKDQACSAIGGSYNANGNSFNNSIFLGYVPFLTGSWHTKKTEAYNNCYTDQDVSPAGMAYTDAQLVQVTTTTGEGVKTAMPNLDWNKVFAANAGTPELRVFHNIIDGTCDRCGLEVFEDPCAKGHTLVSVAEIPATTTTTGVKAHSKCSVCGILLIGETQVTEDDLVIPMIVNYDIWDYASSATGTLYDDKFIVNNEGDGTEANPYIITTAEQLASVTAARVKDADGNTVDTAGKYFKVADHIDAFYMNGGKAVAELKTAAEVKAYFEATPGAAWWVGGNFKGNFDGNGATVYGLYATKENAGLFQNLGAGSVIKNIAVKNSYISASSGNAGAIAGQVQWYAEIGDGTHTFENCVSQNNYIAATNSAGAILGHSRENKIIINNCLAADNDFAGEAYLVGNSWNGGNAISNTVVIDGLVYGNNGSLKKGEAFNGVYTNTDQSGSENEYTAEQVTILEKEAMIPNNMPALDWAKVWINASTPELRAFHNIVAQDNGDGTHTESCDCGLNVKSAHIMADGSCAICGAGCAHTNLGEPVQENVVASTCTTAGSYEKVVYCADCGKEISRETVALPLDPNAHVYDNASDADCNECGATRVLFTYGDLSDDGKINNKDLGLLMQYLNEWDVSINEDAADVNVDGKVNNKDYGLLMQYLNEWDVTLGPKA